MDNPKKKKQDRKLVSKQDHELYYIMGKYDIDKENLLTIMQAAGRSRRKLYAELDALGYGKRSGNWEENFAKIFFDDGKEPNDSEFERAAYAAMQWIKEYSELNPDYNKPREI
jgi:hypothetical protein